MVFVYPRSGADAFLDASQEPILVLPEDFAAEEEEKTESLITPFCRDLPYSWDTLVENLVDPDHVVSLTRPLGRRPPVA